MENKAYSIDREYQSRVRGFCIGMLNRYADIEVKIRSKQSHKTMPFLRIDNIWFSKEDTFNIHQLVKDRSKKIYLVDLDNGIRKETAKQRKKKNTLRETINLVVDILSELEFNVKTKETSGRNNTVKMSIVSSIRKGNEYYGKQQIEEVGERICVEILRRIGNSKSTVIKKNDFQITSLLFQI